MSTDSIVQIPATHGRVILVNAADFPPLAPYHWCATRAQTPAYARASIGGREVLMHRLIMDAQPGQIVDHVNGNGLDNRRENLRFATSAENSANRTAPPAGFSGVRGVTFSRGRWRAQFGKVFLGDFKSAEDAIRAYNAHALATRGEFARPHEVPVTGRLAELCEAMQLSPMETEVLTLNAEGGLAYDVIAERLGTSLHAVRQTTDRIRAKVLRYQEMHAERQELLEAVNQSPREATLRPYQKKK